MSGRYKPFAELITSDGYQVIPNRDKLTRAVLDRGEILIIANALPDGNGGGEGGTNESGSAFTGAESDAIRDWVQDGGSLLLITDHAPFGPAAVPLARRFGVDVSKGGATSDDANSENGATSLVFSRQNHLLGDVVVLGEAGELSAQIVGADEKFGMNVPGIDNRQMALNVMHWLSGLLEPREKALKKAG